MVSLLSPLFTHIQQLPNRNFKRLTERAQNLSKRNSAGELVNKNAEKALKKITEVKASFKFNPLSGCLNSANFYDLQANSKLRRFNIYCVPNHLLSALTSGIAVPGIIVRTALSALAFFVRLPKQGLVNATDPLLDNILKLERSLFLVAKGTIYATAKVVLSVFTDTYAYYYAEKKEESKIGVIGVDLQNAFVKYGNLAVAGGENIIDNSAKILNAGGRSVKVLTQDWHSIEHLSFAVNSGLPNNTSVKMTGLAGQNLWIPHAVQGTDDAQFVRGLPLDKIDAVVPKGYDDTVDSYGGFADNGTEKIGAHKTGLNEYLKKKNVQKVIVFGLATDFCVYFTAMQAKELGYEVAFVKDASAAVNLPFLKDATGKEFGDQQIDKMRKAGIHIVNTDDVVTLINGKTKLFFPTK